jgi:alkylation response protein AidB-like acyl-CoA dehydrogenase
MPIDPYGIHTSGTASHTSRDLQQIAPIFEGTSEIQRVVVARAISGLHIP